MSSSKNIARPRPVSSAGRKISLQMGLQNSSILKSQQHSRALSEPNLKTLVPDLGGLAASVSADPSAPDLLTNQTGGGSDPTLSSKALQPVTTTLPSPLPPVSSALSDDLLTPQTSEGSDPILSSDVLQPVTTTLPSPLPPVLSALSDDLLTPQTGGGSDPILPSDVLQPVTTTLPSPLPSVFSAPSDDLLTPQTGGGSDPILSSDVLQPVTTTLPSPLPPVFSEPSDDLLTPQTSGGSDPILSSDVLQPVTTTLPSPLPPVFSAPSDDLLTPQTGGGSDPILSSDVLQPVTTTLPSPLPPVFSALSDAPLQPQPLTPTTTPSTNIPITTTTTTTTTHDDKDSESTDKYAALAKLDSAFNDPANTPATTVDWSRGGSSEKEPDAETSGPDGREFRTSGVTSPGHHGQGGSGGINWNSTGGSSNPTTPTTPTTPRNDRDSEGLNKYSALADLASVPATTINWGSSQFSVEESAAEASGHNSTDSRNPFSAGSSAGVTFPCSPLPGPQTAAPAAMLAACVQPAPFVVNTNSYCSPATHYGLLATGQPGFGPSPVGNNGVYGYQQIPTHNTAFPSTLPPVGFEGLSAHMGMGSQGVPAQMEGGVPNFISSSSSNPFPMSSPWYGHTPVSQ